ncbi:MAG: hypothetical protein ACFCD0_18650 [Gemmataceae bacterium]
MLFLTNATVNKFCILNALWMGFPVVTLAGETFAQRHGLSHLSRLGLADLVTWNTTDYVALATALAGDLSRLQEFRTTLRQKVLETFCDGTRLTKELLGAIRHAWQDWCAR